MPKFRPVPANENEIVYYFLCPACRSLHALNNTWQFNGDLNKPTVSPSVRVHWFKGKQRELRMCHSYIKDGMIQYLGDCTHKFAGKTVELPDITEDFKEEE